jgi:ornithine carbamoyltransferase
MSASELVTLVESARALQSAAQAGITQPALRGKRFGLLRAADKPESDDAMLFARAAIELGAQVAHIQPCLTELSDPQDVRQTAQVLGRLYDMLVCDGMDPALVRRLKLDAGVPVYDRIASPAHSIAKAAELLDPASPGCDNRRFVLQALLLGAVA